MTITKKINWGFDAGAPNGLPDGAGDRYYAQDLTRDLLYMIDRLGLVFKDIKEIVPFVISGGLVTQGAGTTLNIAAGVGYTKKSVQTVLSYAAVPPTTQDEDIEAIRVNWPTQTNLALPVYTPGGAINYVKISYTDLDGTARARAKKAGNWFYDSSPSFTILVSAAAPTAYELVLDSFTEGGGTFTFSGKKSSGSRYTVSSTPYQLNNAEYLVNHTARVVFTLPVTASVGEVIKIQDIGSRGWQIAQNAGQNILIYNQSTVPGVTGYIQSKTGYASIELECVVANTTWIAKNVQDKSQMKGYILGGDTGAVTAVIEDLNFSNETSVPIAATLDAAKSTGVGVSSNLKGYILGGNTGADTDHIEDLNFATEVSVTIVATLDAAKRSGAGVASNLKGFILGGDSGGKTDHIEDLNFATEVSVTIVATLDTPKDSEAGVSSNLKGYVLGGDAGGVTAVIEDLNFATEASVPIAATLDAAKYNPTGVFSNLKGFVLGGFVAAVTAVIEDLVFSTETSAAISATLDTAKQMGAGVSSNLKGFILGGNAGAVSAVIEDFDFLTETSSLITATLNTAKDRGAGVQGYN